MAKRPRKPSAQNSPQPVQARVLDLLAHAPPAAVAQREQSWTVAVADDLLDEFDGSPATQAAELLRKAEVYEDGPEAALALAAEMERRARAGVRVWPGSDKAIAMSLPKFDRTPEGCQADPAGDGVDPPAPDDIDQTSPED